MVSSLLAAALLAPRPVPVLVIRRMRDSDSELVGRTPQGEFTILRGGSRDSFRAAISPDGGRIAFIASQKLYVAPLRVEAYEGDRGVSARRWVSTATRARTGEWTGAVLFADSASSGPSWSPDGASLVYARPHADSGPRNQGDIMKVEVRRDGTPGATAQLTNLTGDRHRDGSPTYRPDGSVILFSRDADPRGLYTIRPSGGAVTPLGIGFGWDQFSWLPDGSQAVGSRLTGSAAGLFTFGFPKPGTPALLSWSRPSDAFPQVSPDGRSLAFGRPTRVSSSLTTHKLVIAPFGGASGGIQPAPTLITPANTSTGEIPLQWIALTPPR